MTFDTDEKSVADSRPIELYDFITPTVTYRYVSNYGRVYSYLGNDYAPLPIERDVVVTTMVANDIPEVLIKMPASSAFVLENAFGLQPRTIAVVITRVQQLSGAALQWWSGVVGAFTVEGRLANIRSPSTADDPLKTSVPGVVLQGLCNHTLYDSRCTVLRILFDQAATVVSFSGRQLIVSTIGGNPDQWFKAGEVVRTLDGERRLVTSQVGTTLDLSLGFRALAPGDALTMFAGCDHTVLTCRDKFNNVDNFGGHPYVPITNPFKSGLKNSPDI